jgi:hypothetical protein
MEDAAEADYKLIVEGKPAINKVRMLSEVVGALLTRRDDLQTLFVEEGVLSVSGRFIFCLVLLF